MESRYYFEISKRVAIVFGDKELAKLFNELSKLK